MKKILTVLLAFCLLLGATACSEPLSELLTTAETETLPVILSETATEEEVIPPDPEGAYATEAAAAPSLNGWALEEFTIVYSEKQPDYTARAARWLQETVLARTGLTLPLLTVEEARTPLDHEIVVGETEREISRALRSGETGLRVSYIARGGHVAMEGNSFAIAAAVYRFAEDYLPSAEAVSTVSHEMRVCDPVTAEAKHFVLLIGDGMGNVQTRLFEAYAKHRLDYTDGETAFYGLLFPYSGQVITDSLSGTTDSAAGGTALATGTKTSNRRIGRSEDDRDLLSITELAAELGMATAVMSTEKQTGATPSAFTAHASDRDETEAIAASQALLQQSCGTVISCGYNYYTAMELERLEDDLGAILAQQYASEKGSFLMFEEAYIDKHCHDNERDKTFQALARFNQVIGLVMEQAFYHPDTAVIITADHETGGMVRHPNGTFYYTSEGHTGSKVPVFAYGAGMEVFHEQVIENVQIPKTLAKIMGSSLATESDDLYPPLL